ncbi:MAG: alanine racemase [Desulfobacteraceae bacterium]|jgi:alanine racemase
MPTPLIRAEIDLGAIAHNVRELRRITSTHSQLMIAVKANGYGHGAVPIAQTAIENGADSLAVARVEEGLALRNAGIGAPILIFGYTTAHWAETLVTEQLVPTIFSLQNARDLSAAAVSKKAKIPIHINIDTGMGRLGIPCDELGMRSDGGAIRDILEIDHLPGLTVEGLYTHFATADHADKTYANQQFDRFLALTAALESHGMTLPLLHAANSGAIIDMPQTHLDLVRAGISVYGLYPSQEVARDRITLRPALELKSTIIHLKHVPAGTKISYGCTYETSAPTTIATIPAGYGDGYNRRLSNAAQVLVHGQRAPLVGRVCMDLSMVDVGHVDDVAVGDEVVLIGRQGDTFVAADEVADLLGTINYDVVTALTSRVSRVYITSPDD